MIVDQPASLHRGIHGGGPDKDKTVALQRFCQSDGLSGGRGDVGRSARSTAHSRREGPEKLIEPTAATQANDGLGVGDGGPDLEPVADDGRVGHQTFDVGLTEGRDRIGVEPGEGPAKAFALAQDREPGQSRLECFKSHSLIEPGLTANHDPPLVVVIGHVVVGAHRPPTTGDAAVVNHEAFGAQRRPGAGRLVARAASAAMASTTLVNKARLMRSVRGTSSLPRTTGLMTMFSLSLIHISEPTRRT